ncbi:hypothetical protein BV20DRAFT_966157 [Pilatotrama ljubarskyi]|nr:hypothetical protein BV20DRAFT_966157 [Pilatotrama ljubarskyi]
MARSFEESQVAYQLGNHGRARELSEAGNAARLEMERLNEEASEGIFKVNNINSQPGEVDLHGLYVGEAIRYADQAVQKAIARGDSKIRLVVGKGLHSTAGMPKLKPAVEKYLREKGHEAEVDERNPGVLVVSVGDEPMDCSW